MTAHDDGLPDVQRRELFRPRKTVADIVPGAQARTAFSEDPLWGDQVTEEPRLLDHLQTFLGKFGDNGVQQGDIPVVAHAAQPPQSAQIETRVLEEQALLHLADHDDLLHLVALEGPNNLGELSRAILYQGGTVGRQLCCDVRRQCHGGHRRALSVRSPSNNFGEFSGAGHHSYL